MIKTLIYILAISSIFAASCSKDDESVLKINSFVLTTEHGQDNGEFGFDASDQWLSTDNENIEGFGILDEQQNETEITNSGISKESNLRITAYPNPVVSHLSLHLSPESETYFDMIVLDQNRHITHQSSLILKSDTTLNLDFRDFSSGDKFKMIYSLSNENTLNFVKGYGNIGYCPDLNDSYDWEELTQCLR
ncbi:hypothetical protein LVD15_14520 [Fulvivirga maritima]|uniref:hypothetical protein n=1 Tax=Fulvivirga maritima TaxID=2904247 RepID=UPI001F28768F|nr:hypothetical protein [Fulvivirga maritima]UII24537.1 hypothetical protein LVD15_14520 [Fulvivirga maritima]